jgi:DNA-binding response OmpR family regulator
MSSGKINTILIVEDDAMILSGLKYALDQEGYAVVSSMSVKEAQAALAADHYDLVLLDMNLPDGTGFDVRAFMRSAKMDASVLFLTVVDDEGNVVRAFEEGADDYITKPFRLRELLARIKRTLQARSAAEGTLPAGAEASGGETTPDTSTLKLGNVAIDSSAGKAYIGEKLLDLTALEYRLLLLFATHRGQILSRTQILEGIWDAAGSFIEDNTLTVYIKRLREKLGDSATIETVRGMGYRAD